MELPVSQLCRPPRETHLLRQADPTFIRNLKVKMIQDPSAPGVTPMAVLCKDVRAVTEFAHKYKDVYNYEVLGGLHTLMAKRQLCEEYPDNPFFNVALTEVYVNLSDEEALRLAQRHNLNSHFVHKVTHRDLVSVLLCAGLWLCTQLVHRFRLKLVEQDCIVCHHYVPWTSRHPSLLLRGRSHASLS